MNFEAAGQLQRIIDEKNAEINQLKATLEQLKNQQQQVCDYYESILAVMPGHVYWLDKYNIFMGCNDLQAKHAQLKSRKEIVGKTNYDMPWKDQADEINRLNTLVMETGRPHTAEEYAVMADGLAIFFSQKTPLRNQQGEIFGVLGISIDITERKKMEVALRRAKETAEISNYTKTEFIANMTQDIHTPLNGIVVLSQHLEDLLVEQEEKQYAQWIKESGTQLLALLKKVLSLVTDERINNNDLSVQIFDLRQSVESIIQLVQPSAKIKNIDLVLEIDQSIPALFITDGAKLHRILLNLIGNAIKFTDKGSICLKTELIVDNKEYVQLKFSVKDTGIGIPEDMHTKVFNRLFRVNSSSNKESDNGHGVGLHIAQNYVGLLGGEIKLESQLGKGSTFYFTLPMKVMTQQDTESPGAKNSIEKKEKNRFPLHLLFVEANIVALRFVETLAVQNGFNFSSASDPKIALDMIKKTDFDLILTDIDFPGISGEELALSIRSLEKSSEKVARPIVGLTSNKLDESHKLYKSGFNKIISKPIDLNSLKELVEEFVVVDEKG